MDKIFSARIDEAVIHRIEALSQLLGTSKKKRPGECHFSLCRAS